MPIGQLKANMSRLISDYGDGNYVDLCDVYVQDQSTDIIDIKVCRSLNEVTLAVDTAVDDNVLTFEAGHGFVVGNGVCLKRDTLYYQGEVVAVDGNDVTVDAPIDAVYTAADTAFRSDHDLNVDGSTTSVTFSVQPPSGVKWDITRVMFAIRDATAMDDALFGGMSALTYGVQFRRCNGRYQNVFNIKTNGDMMQHAYDVEYSAKAPAGEYGIRCRRSFAGQDKNGVTIRLDGDSDDQFQVIVQDDLTDLTYFEVVVQGHIVE